MSQIANQPVLELKGQRSFINGDAVLALLARGSAIFVLLMLVVLIGVLVFSAIPSFRTFGLKFLVSSDWRVNEIPAVGPNGGPVYEDGERVMSPPVFGALPVIYGTVVSSLLALFLAVPLSFGAAVFLIRIAPYWLVPPVSFLIEFLAAIPSIAFGMWGLFVLAPFLQNHGEPFLAMLMGGTHYALTGRDMLCGGLILGIMILPIITAISRDVLATVPRAQVEGAIALGATWWQSVKEMLKYSRSGLFGAVMLGLARASGETMAVAMVIGNFPQIKLSLFAPAQTMSSLLANEFAESESTLQRPALLEVALILLLMSLAFNIVARWLVVGKQSRTAAAH